MWKRLPPGREAVVAAMRNVKGRGRCAVSISWSIMRCSDVNQNGCTKGIKHFKTLSRPSPGAASVVAAIHSVQRSAT